MMRGNIDKPQLTGGLSSELPQPTSETETPCETSIKPSKFAGKGSFLCAPSVCEECYAASEKVMNVLVYQKSTSALKKKDADEVKFVDVYATAAKWKAAVAKIENERVRECAGGFCAHTLARVRVTNSLKGK